MLGRSRFRDRGRGSGVGGANLLNQATIYLGGVQPYHYADFITNRMLYAGADVGTVAGGTGYSFTRASDGYYTNSDGTLTNFASGALRRGDRGVLIEGARTNLMLYSQDFTQANWALDNSGAVNPVVTANYGLAPDGTMTADRIQLDKTGGTFARIAQMFGGLTLASYTASVWMRTISGTANVGLRNDSTGINCAVTTTWQRFVLTVSTTAPGVQILLFDSIPGNDETADILAWGAQLEAASFPSSYIPTVAASATRAADVLTYTVNTTAQINAAVAGQPELVTNGGFATDTDWTKGADWTISAGTANYNNAGGAQVLSQAISLVEAKFYAVTYTVSALSSGFIYARLQGGSNINGATRTANGTYTELIAAPSAPTAIGFVAQGVLSIDNISIKEVPANSLTLYPLQLWSEFERAVDTGADEVYFQIDAGSTNDRAAVFVTSSDLANGFVRSGNVTQMDNSVLGAVAVGATTKTAVRVATNDGNVAKGGTLGTQDTSLTLPASPTRLVVGSNGSGAHSFGYIRRAAVIQGAGTDANLQAMTS